MSDTIIEILNKDEKAKRLNTKFNQMAKEQGLSGKELEETRKTFLMMVIASNKEAMNAMADEAYDELLSV